MRICDLNDIFDRMLQEGVTETENKMLKGIHEVLCDEGLDDFMTVEKITEIFEKNGFDSGGRHEF